MVLGFVLNIAIIRLGVLCILFISALWHQSSCRRIGQFTNFWGDGSIWTAGAGRIWAVVDIQILSVSLVQIYPKAKTRKSIKEPEIFKWNNRQYLIFHCLCLIKCTRKTEIWGQAYPRINKLSWANQEKWKTLGMIRLWYMSWLNLQKNGWKWLAGKDAVAYTWWHENRYKPNFRSSKAKRKCKNKL